MAEFVGDSVTQGIVFYEPKSVALLCELNLLVYFMFADSSHGPDETMEEGLGDMSDENEHDNDDIIAFNMLSSLDLAYISRFQ